MPFGEEMWLGELDDGKYHIIIGCANKVIRVIKAETEYGLYDKKNAWSIATLGFNQHGEQYVKLKYTTMPAGNCEIIQVLDLLEWEYKKDEIWC